MKTYVVRFRNFGEPKLIESTPLSPEMRAWLDETNRIALADCVYRGADYTEGITQVPTAPAQPPHRTPRKPSRRRS